MPKIGAHFPGTVRDLAADGSGIVQHPDGQVFFIAGVWPGEQGVFRVTGFRGRAGLARIEEITAPAPDRVTPACAHHGVSETHCGGCPWQFMAYDAQLAQKSLRVATAMTRLGVSDTVQAIWGAPEPYGYRNRAQLKTDGRSLGYMAAGTHTLIPIADCPILSEPNRRTLQALLDSLPNAAFRPPPRERWTTVDIDEDMTASQVCPNARRPFRQGNTRQNHRMQDWLRRVLEPLDRSATVLELFAGSGNFTEVAAGMGFARIVAIDSAADAIATLAARSLPRVEATAINLYSETGLATLNLPTLAPEIVLLDPPRDGFRQIGALFPRRHRVHTVCYISCDLATFSRDLQVLLDCGFMVKELQPLDQFPHTPHIELLALLQQR